MKAYVDDRGWRYQVMPGLGVDTHKARYNKPGTSGWKCCKNLPWRDSPQAAQADLDTLAKAKGWKEATPCN